MLHEDEQNAIIPATNNEKQIKSNNGNKKAHTFILYNEETVVREETDLNDSSTAAESDPKQSKFRYDLFFVQRICCTPFLF
jgi:hypothetical protein